MSIKNLNKIIIVSSALTGNVIQSIDYDDYINIDCARDFLADKIFQLIDDDQGAIIKIGSKT